MGPSYDNNQPPSERVVLLEVGGGSGGVDLIGIQLKLAESNYTVCTYDRAGYGMSDQSTYPQSANNSMDIMIKAMKAVNFPSDDRRVVCIGHSAGGQLCRNYAKYWKAIKGIILLDSYPVNILNYYTAEKQNVNP